MNDQPTKPKRRELSKGMTHRALRELGYNPDLADWPDHWRMVVDVIAALGRSFNHNNTRASVSRWLAEFEADKREPGR